MSDRITEALTLDALAMALARRQPSPGLLHQWDRGSQYASGDYQRVLAQSGIVSSMSGRGNCWDNAVVESLFATLKVELVHDAVWTTRAAARVELVEYLEVFDNGTPFGLRLPQPPSVRAAARIRSTGNSTQVSLGMAVLT